VHRVLGPGLLETKYEEAMCIELADAKIRVERQNQRVPVVYKNRVQVLKAGLRRLTISSLPVSPPPRVVPNQ
jgi:GxxExxY protein